MASQAHWDFPRPVASIRALLELAAAYGLGPERCLAGSAIDPALLDDPAVVVPTTGELQVIRNLQRYLGPDRALGLEAGQRLHPTSYGIWGFAVMSSATFASAIAVGERYLLLTSMYCRISARVAGNEAQLVLDEAGLPADVSDFLIERTIGALINIQYDLDRAGLPVKALRLKRSPPVWAARFAELFDVSPEFGQPENVLAVDVRCLGLKLPQANALTLRYCEEECQRLLRQYRQRGGLAGRLRDRLSRNPAYAPAMEAMAEELRLHPRTLRRRLAEEGVDYKSLVDEVHGALAEELLKTTGLSLEEISERLGYSEPSSFTRAFKRWKSMSPSRFRQSLDRDVASSPTPMP